MNIFTTRNRISGQALAVFVTISMLVSFMPFSVHVASAQEVINVVEEVTICHATNSHANPYGPKPLTVDYSSIVTIPNGHDDHTGPVWFSGIQEEWGDIIPPFWYPNGDQDPIFYPGLNWDTDGQEIYEAKCQTGAISGSISGVKFDDVDGDGESREDGESGLKDWVIRLYEVDQPWVLVDTTTTDETGGYEFAEIPEGTYKVCEVMQDDWTQTFVSNGTTNESPDVSEEGPECQTVNIDKEEETNTVNFGNHYEEPKRGAKIIAHKLVCEDEADIPNWGGGASNITEEVVNEWLEDDEDSCEPEPGWKFEWGPQNAFDPGDTTTGEAGDPWTPFGPTDDDGMAMTEVSADVVEANKHLWFREVLQEGYIPFTHDNASPKNSNDVTAEMYCHTDVLNYDNYDRIDKIEEGETYYCLAWNHAKDGSIHGAKWYDRNMDAQWGEEPGLKDWSIELYDGDDLVSSTTTDENGEFWFTDLRPGVYNVCEVIPEGWVQSYPGTDDGCHEVAVGAGESVKEINFGNYEKPDEPSQCEIGENLLKNASFEDPVVTDHGGQWELFDAIPNWASNILTNGIELQRGLFGGAADGEQHAELDVHESTSLTQTVVTIPGATYELRFDFSARDKNAADNSVEATADGSVVVSASTDNEDWVEYSNTFVAGDASTDITFTDKGTSNGKGTLIDDAILCLVEEPEWCAFEGSVTGYTPDEDADQNDGDPVAAARRNPAAVETVAPYQNTNGKEGNDWQVDPLDFFSLGIEGYLVYEFSDKVALDEAGPDIAVYEITGGNKNQQTDEKIEVSVSEDGISFVSLGEFTGDAEIDIAPAGLDYVKYVRLDDKSSGVQGNNGDGYDVDAIVILNCGDEPEEEYGPYCGDGEVNQPWEECDGTDGCTLQCQPKEQNQCTDLTLAKINMTEFSNTGAGDMTDDIFLGTSSLPIPNNVWFRVYEDGVYDNDENMNVAGYEDVPGLAVERQDGALRIRMFGSATKNDVEHVRGDVQFWSYEDEVTATAVSSDNSQNNKLENEEPGMGTMAVEPGNDEVWLDGDDAFFWLTTTTADDGFYVDYSNPVECDACLIDGYKFDHNGEPLEGWEIGLAKQNMFYYLETRDGDGDQDDDYWSEPWIMDTDITGDDGYYCLNPEREEHPERAQEVAIQFPGEMRTVVYEVMKEGWENIKVEIDGHEAEEQSDSFFDIFVEVELGEDERVDFYNKEEDRLVCTPDLELLANGGFEEPVVDNDAGWNIFDSGIAWLVDWVSPEDGATDPASLEIHRNVNGWLPNEGDQYAELDGDYEGPGGGSGESASTEISQTVDTIPGETYTLRWDFSPRPGTTDANNVLDVYVSDQNSGDPVATNGGTTAGDQTEWESHTYSFVATDDETTVTFADDGNSNSTGTFVDNISLMCEPETPYGPYCGDGFVDDWEQCDDGLEGSDSCTSMCTFANQCSTLQLAKIDLDQTESESFDGKIYLGSASNPIPAGTWFKWDVEGDDSANSIADSVDGLAVERDQTDGLKLAFRGGNGRKDFDNVEGSIELKNLKASLVDRYIMGTSYKLENTGKGKDTVTEVDNYNVDFDMRANTGDDGFTMALLVDEESINECSYTLTVDITGEGFGLVDSTDENISCNTQGTLTQCQYTYAPGTVVDLTATPDEGSNFDNSWSVGAGSCTGNTSPCQVTMDSDIDLTAHFDLDSGSNSSGGGGGRRSSGGGGGDDDEEIVPVPQVAGEQVSVIPFGAPNAGAGGTSETPLGIAFVLTALAVLVGVKRYAR